MTERDNPYGPIEVGYSADERMVYAEVQRVRHSDDGSLIPDHVARVISNWWHGGQSSYLYSFASSGAINLEGVLDEIRHNSMTPETDDETESLDELKRYFTEHGDRPRVEDWAKQTEWNHLRVATEEQLMRVVHVLAPLAFMDQADDGELVIFTRLQTGEDGTLEPVEKPDDLQG